MSLYATQDEKKQAAAKAALKHLPKGGILGVGTGSTVNFLIDLLPELQLEAAVASSEATAERLKKLGIEVVDMNSVGSLDAYVDGEHHKGGVTFNIYNDCKLAHAYVLLVDNTPANISNALVAPAAKNAPVYNLAGQQVGASYKGVVIKNGKKYVQK